MKKNENEEKDWQKLQWKAERKRKGEEVEEKIQKEEEMG